MMSLLAKSALSQLVVIDMQVRLADVMPTDAMQAVVKNCRILLQAAKLLEVSAIITEQYPQGFVKYCSGSDARQFLLTA